MRKTKVFAISAAVISIAVIPARAQLGLDGAILVAIKDVVTQSRQIAQGVSKTRDEVMQAANYIRHPQSWKSYLDRATSISDPSNGADRAELDRINSMLRATREAYSQFSYTKLGAGDMARMNQLGVQMMDLQQRSDMLNASILSSEAYQTKVHNDDGWGCVSCTLGAHQR